MNHLNFSTLSQLGFTEQFYVTSGQVRLDSITRVNIRILLLILNKLDPAIMSGNTEVQNMKDKKKEMMDDRDEGLFVRLLMLDELKISKQESSDNIDKTFSYEDLKPEKLQTLKHKK